MAPPLGDGQFWWPAESGFMPGPLRAANSAGIGPTFQVCPSASCNPPWPLGLCPSLSGAVLSPAVISLGGHSRSSPVGVQVWVLWFDCLGDVGLWQGWRTAQSCGVARSPDPDGLGCGLPPWIRNGIYEAGGPWNEGLSQACSFHLRYVAS